MLGIGFVGGPFVGAWFTSSIVTDLVYVFYLAIGFFLMCAIVMSPIPRGMKALQPRPAEKYELNNNNNNNREDTAMVSKWTTDARTVPITDLLSLEYFQLRINNIIIINSHALRGFVLVINTLYTLNVLERRAGDACAAEDRILEYRFSIVGFKA